MKRSILVVLLFFALGIVSSYLSAADKYSGTPAARAEFAKGKTASQSEQWDKAVAAYKRAIEIDPNFAEAYDQLSFARMRQGLGDLSAYTKMSEAERKELEERLKKADETVAKEYEDLLRQHPEKPIYHWVLGERYNESNPELQEKYCKEAVELDPKFSQGYECLAAVASLRGDWKSAAEYQRKVIALNPDNKESWRLLQWFVQSDPQEFKATTSEIGKKFPDSDAAVQALLTYTEKLPQAERISSLEEIVTKYPPKKFRSASEAADNLFDLYDRTDPAKAAALAHKVLGGMPKDKDWKAKVAYADSMGAAEAKIAANDGQGALTILKDVKAPGFAFSKTRLQLLTAKAEDVAGKTADAYGGLLKVFAEDPVAQVQSALYQYGKKLDKSEKAVDDEVWGLRSAKATPAIPFALESFIDGKKVSLDDFKGKVVLLDFWYPNCGPCMRAMPYLQSLWSKYKDDGLVFLGVNGMEGQAPFVMPLVKSRGWGFIPLKGDSKWCSEVYKVRGYPTTFLVGADGKVYFKPHTYNQEKHDVADLQIQALLAAAKNTNAVSPTPTATQNQPKQDQAKEDQRAKEMEKYLQSLPADARERQKALQTVYAAKTLEAKAEAAVEFLRKYPDYTDSRSLVFNVFYERKNQEKKATPEEVQSAIKTFLDGTAHVSRSMRCEFNSSIASTLQKRGILTDAAIDIAKQGIALLNEDEYVEGEKKQHESRESYRKNDPKYEPEPFSRNEAIEHYKGFAAGLYATLGNLYVSSGKLDLAEEAYQSSYKIRMVNDASVGLSKIAEQRGDLKKAFDYYVDAMLNGRLNGSEIEHLRELHGKVRSGGDEDLQRCLDDVYRSRYKNPLVAERFHRADSNGRAVIAELVTGAGCEPCTSVDMAFEATLKKYQRNDLILLAYDWHAPSSDPLSNPGVESRVKYYNLNSAPNVILDGKPAKVGDGAVTEAQRVFANLDRAVLEQMAIDPKATVKVSGKLVGGKIEAKVSVSGVTAPRKDLRLHIALVSREVTYSGENGLRFHEMVMRNLARPAGSETYGYPLTAESAVVEHVFDLDQISAEILKYYDWYIADLKERTKGLIEASFKEKRNVIAPHELSVVAFLQDDATKEILQGSYAEVSERMPAVEQAK